MTSTLPRTPYRIRTPRLTLRCFRPEDTTLRMEAVQSSGDHLREFFKDLSLDEHALQVRRMRMQFDGDDFRSHAIFEDDGQRFLGETGLMKRVGIDALEIAYWFRKDATGRGLATEAASAMVKVAFEYDGVRRLDLICAPSNERSAAMAKRLGFVLEARLRDRQIAAHHPRGDILVHSMLASEYPSTPAASLTLQAWDFLDRPLAPRSA